MLRCRCLLIRTPRARLSSLPRSGDQSATTNVKSDEGEVDPVKTYTMFGNVRKDVFHYTDRKSGTGYSDFSTTVYQHRPYIWPPLRRLFKVNFFIAGAMLILTFLDYEWISEQLNSMGKDFKPEASQSKHEGHEVLSESKSPEEVESTEKRPEKPKKKKIGFRERRIIEYEDRIRMYSTPDKIFRYFATLKVIDKNDESGRTFEVFMTPEDFLRSFTPGVMQPRKYGLDSYKIYQPEKYKHKFSDKKSIFYKLGENGLISFSDYLFLMTLLSTSPNDFALAFKIFDINGDGALDKEEFLKVQHLIMSQTTVGQRHRDHITPNSSFRVESNSALEHYFFGADGVGKLSASKFLEFQESLYSDILRMEFDRRDALDGVDGLISEVSFGELLLMHAQIPEKRQKLMLKRLKKKFKGSSQGISFEETHAFFRFLYHIDSVDMALHFHRMAGLPVDAKLLKRVAHKITGVHLNDHVLDVVVTLFDDNMDGKLSNNEMIAVMRRRMRRGLERPRDTGLFRLVDALRVCSLRAYHASPLSFQ
ncbi:Calcium uptake protein 1 mitochondrial [Trichostrongylus colubriformis]|uniref:Calcium uptake protein 1 mitochondrial n=1 Tax=Trichostrongylus colubriformis TaxID=6319 RepID=A0AAN8FAB1_TRICO